MSFGNSSGSSFAIEAIIEWGPDGMHPATRRFAGFEHDDTLSGGTQAVRRRKTGGTATDDDDGFGWSGLNAKQAGR